MLDVMKVRMFRSAILLAPVALLCLGEETSEPWSPAEVLEPAALAQTLQSGKAPMVVSVAFPVLYRSRHILHAIDAGPTSKPEGIDALKKAVAGLAKNADVVLYCGCCPMVKCPNIRPAYRMLKELGFTHIRVLSIPTNLHEDWYSKNYPFEPGSAAQ